MTEPQIQLHFDGDSYFTAAIQLIEDAQTEVLIESYIFDLDPIGLRVLKAAEIAVSRGAQVYLIVDGIGSFNWLEQIEKKCIQIGVQFRAYHPLPLTKLSLISWRQLRRWLRFFKKINRRDHRKMISVDRKSILIGSLNISQVHSKEFLDENAWRDTALLLKYSNPEPETLFLASSFFKTWHLCSKFRTRNLSGRLFDRSPRNERINPLQSRFRLNTSPWARYRLLLDLRAKMKNAKERILITNAYFLPRRSILKALRQAAKRGVYVGLILPHKTDVWFVREASRSLYYRLIKSGVHIFEYTPRVLHAKTLVIDDWATIGSHNLNHRSMLHDLELEAVVKEKDSIEELIKKWDQDAQSSLEINLTELGKFTWYRRFFSRILYWFRYWL